MSRKLDLPKASERKYNIVPAHIRLRYVLKSIWEKDGSVGLFEEFYSGKMELIINHYQNKYLNA